MSIHINSLSGIPKIYPFLSGQPTLKDLWNNPRFSQFMDSQGWQGKGITVEEDTEGNPLLRVSGVLEPVPYDFFTQWPDVANLMREILGLVPSRTAASPASSMQSERAGLSTPEGGTSRRQDTGYTQCQRLSDRTIELFMARADEDRKLIHRQLDLITELSRSHVAFSNKLLDKQSLLPITIVDAKPIEQVTTHQSELESLRKERDSLKKTIHAQDKRTLTLESLSEKITEMEQSQIDLSGKKDQLEKDVRKRDKKVLKLERKLSEKQNQNETLQRFLIEEKTKHEARSEEFADFEKTFADMWAEAKAKTEVNDEALTVALQNLADKDDAIDEADQALAAFQIELEKSDQTGSKAQEQLKLKCAEAIKITEQLKEAKETNQNQSELVSTLKEKIQGLIEANKDAAVEIESYQLKEAHFLGENVELNKKIEDLKITKRELEALLVKTRDSSAEEKKNLHNQFNQLTAQLNHKYDLLMGEFLEKMKEGTQLKSELEILKKAYIEIASEREILKKAYAEIAEALYDKKGLVEKQADELEALNKSKEQLSHKHNALMGEFANAKASLNNLQQQIKTVESEREILKKAYVEVAEALYDKKGLVEKQADELEALNKSKEQLNHKHNALIGEFANAKSSLNNLQQQIKTLESEREILKKAYVEIVEALYDKKGLVEQQSTERLELEKTHKQELTTALQTITFLQEQLEEADKNTRVHMREAVKEKEMLDRLFLELNRLSQEKDALQWELSEVQRDRTAIDLTAQTREAQLQEEIVFQEAQIQRFFSHLATIHETQEQELETHLGQLGELHDQLLRLQSLYAMLEKSSEESDLGLKKQIEQLQEENSKLKAQSELKEAVARTTEEANSKYLALEEQLRQHQKEAAALKDELAAEKQLQETEARKLKAVEESLLETTAKLEASRGEVAALTEKLALVERKLEQKETSAIETQAIFDQAMKNLEQELANKNSQIQSSQSDLANRNETISALEARLAAYEEPIIEEPIVVASPSSSSSSSSRENSFMSPAVEKALDNMFEIKEKFNHLIKGTRYNKDVSRVLQLSKDLSTIDRIDLAMNSSKTKCSKNIQVYFTPTQEPTDYFSDPDGTTIFRTDESNIQYREIGTEFGPKKIAATLYNRLTPKLKADVGDLFNREKRSGLLYQYLHGQLSNKIAIDSKKNPEASLYAFEMKFPTIYNFLKELHLELAREHDANEYLLTEEVQNQRDADITARRFYSLLTDRKSNGSSRPYIYGEIIHLGYLLSQIDKNSKSDHVFKLRYLYEKIAPKLKDLLSTLEVPQASLSF